MRVYTKRGDDGTTGLLYGGRVRKDSAQLVSYGAFDEAQAFLGQARAEAGPGSDLDPVLVALARDLWVLMAELALNQERRDRGKPGQSLVTEDMVVRLEALIDNYTGRFEAPRSTTTSPPTRSAPVSQNLPESELPDVREYLYLDVPRVRSLLAHLDAGVTESDTSMSARSAKWNAGLQRFLGTERDESETTQRTRSLGDLHVAMLEEQATIVGLLRDLSDQVTKPKRWKRGNVHRALQEGALIRVTAPTRLFDPRAVAKTLVWWSEAMDDQDPFAQNVSSLTKAMYGGHLSLRVLPCGEKEPGCAFVGQIVDAHGYLAGERGTLFARLGADVTEWTTLAQVTRLPGRHPAGSMTLAGVSTRFQQAMQSTGSFDRHDLELMLTEIMRELELQGLQEAPVHPSVAVVPLAVYRHVLPSRAVAPVPGEDDPDD